MTNWIAKTACRLDRWWSAKRKRQPYLVAERDEAAAWAESKRKAMEQERDNMRRELAGIHLTIAAIIRANGGKVRVERRHFGQVQLDEFIIVTEDASHRTFKIERREPPK